jgi:hypothetical protein
VGSIAPVVAVVGSTAAAVVVDNMVVVAVDNMAVVGNSCQIRYRSC